MSANLIGHIQIPATDLEKSKAYYDGLFDWNLKPFGKGYYLYNSQKGTTVGLQQVKKVAKGETPTFHLNVENIEAILKKNEELGGKTVREKTVIPAYGWYALISDPDGNVLGLYQRG